MSKFDTHGGYFSPKGYFKVNEGGSHAENPNGGVQIGVDPEGVPNMLEEGEPVYNDYVYSDNIKANLSVLKKYNIPEKYAGKLYSEIADIFVDEAAERPNDPVSNNGLNAMLVRLADAQEEQKMKKQQKELEDELAQLSPEELAELEQMLSQPEMVQPQENPEEVVPEMVQQPVESEQHVPGVQQQAIMADGGEINSYSGNEKGSSRMNRFSPVRFNRLDWPSTNAWNGFNSPKYDKLDEVITTLRDVGVNTPSSVDLLDKTRSLNPDLGIEGVMHEYSPDSTVDISPFSFKGSTLLDTYLNNNVNAVKDPLGAFRFATSDPAVKIDPTPSATSLTDAVKNVKRLPKEPPLPDDFNPNAWAEARAAEGAKMIADRNVKNAIPEISARAKEVIGKETERALSPNVSPATAEPSIRQTLLATHPELKGGSNSGGNPVMLPTWPRYAGALMNGAMAIYNAFQEPDKYKLPRYTPVLPSGRMDLIDPSFRPLDQNMAVNDVLSSSAGTTRALQNSGLGPSIAGTLLAQDYNTGRNIGTALESVWEANNRERNNIIAARNQNASALGNFNYGQSRDRANILNQAALHNNQNDLYLQRLNYAAEAEKYAALQSQLDSIAQALAGIGRENFAMNQLNSNTAFNYGVTPYGWGYYQGYKCGGKLKK